jgi:uncharacterized protein
MVPTAPLRWLHRTSGPRHNGRRLALEAPVLTRLLILQPTPFCNIDCDYCYLPGRDDKRRMTATTVRRATERLRQDGLAGDELTVVWHSGEPLAMPITFYEESFEIIERTLGPRCRVTHSIQTNATLIDDDWCRLFLRHGVRVGVSVDGPAALHDRHRRTRQGKGTHALVLRGLERLRAHDVPCHAIAVVTKDTLDQADAFCDFFVEQGIAEVGCNFDEAEGGHAVSSLVGREAAHAAFLQRLLQRSLASRGALVVRELAAAWRLVAEPLPEYRFAHRLWPDNAQVMPFALLSVAWNGDFSTFSPELLGQPSAKFGNFVLGNVETGGYLQQAETPAMQDLWGAIAEGVEACSRECAYFGYCGGGAPANKFYENGSFAGTETMYCRSMLQRPFEIVLRQLEQECADAPITA